MEFNIPVGTEDHFFFVSGLKLFAEYPPHIVRVVLGPRDSEMSDIGPALLWGEFSVCHGKEIHKETR